MPAKNSIKQYLLNGYYHLYNRGVEKRNIFQDDQDFRVFLSYLKNYLEPKNKTLLNKELAKASYKQKDKILKQISLNNFSGKIELIAYCLMRNHFHLLLKQNDERGIESFMKSLATRYVMYFNRRHKRVGGLFQDVYKAVLVNSDEQLVYLSRYIHTNPLSKRSSLLAYPYSSLGMFISQWQAQWLKPEIVLDFFNGKTKSYMDFITSESDLDEGEGLIANLIID